MWSVYGPRNAAVRHLQKGSRGDKSNHQITYIVPPGASVWPWTSCCYTARGGIEGWPHHSWGNTTPVIAATCFGSAHWLEEYRNLVFIVEGIRFLSQWEPVKHQSDLNEPF